MQPVGAFVRSPTATYQGRAMAVTTSIASNGSMARNGKPGKLPEINKKPTNNVKIIKNIINQDSTIIKKT